MESFLQLFETNWTGQFGLSVINKFFCNSFCETVFVTTFMFVLNYYHWWELWERLTSWSWIWLDPDWRLELCESIWNIPQCPTRWRSWRSPEWFFPVLWKPDRKLLAKSTCRKFPDRFVAVMKGVIKNQLFYYVIVKLGNSSNQGTQIPWMAFM